MGAHGLGRGPEVGFLRPAVSQLLTADGLPRFHGRRRGKRLRAGRQKLMDTLLPKLRVDPRAIAGADEGNGDPRALFARPLSAVWLEIGFGGGEHLAAQAQARPDIGFIGAEPFRDGVGKLMSAIERDGQDNILVYDDDVRKLLPVLGEGSLDRVFILFPDPWPKKRHHDRRLIGTETVDALSRVLADGGELRFASDHMDYVRWALDFFRRSPDLQWTARTAADWRVRPADAIETRYEAKARAKGDECVYLSFRRRPRET